MRTRPLLDLLSGPRLAAAVEGVAEARLPAPVLKALVRAWVRAFDVDMSESARRVDAFTSLNDFFTRALRPGLRPIAEAAGGFVSPADGVLSFVGRLDANAALPDGVHVKGQGWTAAELLGRPAPEFAHGHAAVIYLSPRDYHRVHAPAAARVAAVTPLPGARYPVNQLGLREVPSLFTRNLRTVFSLDTADLGRLELIMVGATNVGRISASVGPGMDVEVGAELGQFNLGSTVVLLWDGRPAESPRIEGTAPRAVRVGERLAVPP